MENFGWGDPSPNLWSNQNESNISGSETDYCVVNSKSGFNESLFVSSSLDQMQFDNDRVNEMIQYLVSPTFNLAANNSVLDNINSAFYPLPESLNQTSQELQICNASKENVSVLFNPIASGNLSSGESEATSQCSSQSNPSKRKFEDMHYNSLQYFPVSISSGTAAAAKGFQIHFNKTRDSKKPKQEECSSQNIDFRQESSKGNISYEPDTEAIAQVKEMIYRAAAMRPVNLVLEEAAVVDKPKRKNVKISNDPQTVAARHRREKIGERLRILQRLVPGGSKMDTASMLDEAANYLKFLKSQVSALENLRTNPSSSDNCFQVPFNLQSTLFNP